MQWANHFGGIFWLRRSHILDRCWTIDFQKTYLCLGVLSVLSDSIEEDSYNLNLAKLGDS